MNQVILLTFVIAIALVPYSNCQNCEASLVTVIDEKGQELGACKSPDVQGKVFTYIKKENGECCESSTGRYKNYCINYR